MSDPTPWVTIYRIEGRIDTFQAAKLDRRLMTGLTAGARKVIMDCGNLEYITSTGLGVLYKIARHLHHRQGTLVICALEEYLREIFVVVGLGHYLPTVKTVEDAYQIL